MAIVTRRHRMVTGFFPAIVLVVHDVAVLASRRVIGQIRCALAIPKGVRPGNDEEAAEDDESLFQGAVPLHHFRCRNGRARQTKRQGKSRHGRHDATFAEFHVVMEPQVFFTARIS